MSRNRGKLAAAADAYDTYAPVAPNYAGTETCAPAQCNFAVNRVRRRPSGNSR